MDADLAHKFVIGCVCAGCKSRIVAPSPVLTALDKHWHPEHFNCCNCGTNLAAKDGPRAVKVNDSPLCEGCYRDTVAPRCAGCGEPISGTFNKMAGKTFHPTCFTCGECRKPLAGSGPIFKSGRGASLCRPCFLAHAAPKCAVCGKGMTKYKSNPVTGEKYCLVHDGAEISGHSPSTVAAPSARMDGVTPKCFSCSRRANPDTFHDYPDGRSVCGGCAAVAVWRDDHAAEALHTVRRFFIDVIGLTSMADDGLESPRQAVTADGTTIGGCKDVVPPPTTVTLASGLRAEGTFATIPIRMVDRVKMNSLVKKVGSHDVKTLGLTQSMLKTKTRTVTSTSKATKLEAADEAVAALAGVYSSLDGVARPVKPRTRPNPAARVTETTVSKSKNIKCVSVLQGLPRTQLCSVIAHELGHCYLILRGFHKDLSPVVVEGLCELFAYVWLSHQTDKDPEAGHFVGILTANPDVTYGSGLRSAIASMEALPPAGTHPLIALLKHVRKFRSFPVTRK